MKKIEEAIGVRISCDTVDVNVCAYLLAFSFFWHSSLKILVATFLVASRIKIATAGSPRKRYFFTRIAIISFNI